MRRLVTSLIVVIVLALVGDSMLRGYVERRISREASRGLGLAVEPEVSLGGFPFTLHLARGEIPAVEVRAARLTSRGITIERVELELREVEFSLDDLASGDASVAAGSGSGHAVFTEQSLDAALARRAASVDARIEGNRVLLSSPGLPVEAEARLSLRRNSLVVVAPRRGATTIPLPALGRGLRYRSVKVAGGVVRLYFSIDRARLDLGELK